jgi:para-aminobenzoate synthetase/4-amino-4-deoxychorismate lyase
LTVDPALGVFETFLVLDGSPVELDTHLQRLRASVGELYGLELPGNATEVVAAEASGLTVARMRLQATPVAGAGLELSTTSAEVDPELLLPGHERALALRSVVVAGGLGAHKWVDRGFLSESEAAFPPDTLSLLVDGDGAVLEASRANVFAAREGVVRTPPADGRILPGTVRGEVLELARDAGIEAREERLKLADLLAADEVMVTSSIRGIEPVRELDGTALAAAERVRPLLSEAVLGRLWGAEG